MKCPRTGLILRLVSGELSPLDEKGLREHLQECPMCEAAWIGLRETWDALGKWQVAIPGSDSREAVIRVTRAEIPEAASSPSRAAGWMRAFRIAASIAIAAGLGIAAGTVVPIPDPQPDQPAATAEDVAEGLGITELGSRSATGLSLGFGVNGTPAGKEASP